MDARARSCARARGTARVKGGDEPRLSRVQVLIGRTNVYCDKLMVIQESISAQWDKEKTNEGARGEGKEKRRAEEGSASPRRVRVRVRA